MSSPGSRPDVILRTRRGILGAAGMALLAGCGWQPIYATRSDGTSGPAAQGLAEISVGLMPDRLGQVLRQALQTRFERAGSGVAKRYDLVASFGVAGEALYLDQTTSIPSRYRMTGLASWSLISMDARRRTLTSGSARVMDGFNIYDQQYFAMDMENEAVQQRLAGAVADQITLQLAAWFNRHPTAD